MLCKFLFVIVTFPPSSSSLKFFGKSVCFDLCCFALVARAFDNLAFIKFFACAFFCVLFPDMVHSQQRVRYVSIELLSIIYPVYIFIFVIFLFIHYQVTPRMVFVGMPLNFTSLDLLPLAFRILTL